MGAPASLLPELEDVVQNGTAERRAETLRRITGLFLDGAVNFNDEHVALFDDEHAAADQAGERGKHRDRGRGCRDPRERRRHAPAPASTAL